ncbi:MAG: HD domain-containing protein [Rhizobiaceae bacterium]
MRDKSQTVSFTQMKKGTREDYMLLRELEKDYHLATSDRLIEELENQGRQTLEGYKITRLDHGLQSATRAQKDGADLDWIIGALLHDIGDRLAPQNHDRMSAEIIRPFVRWEVSWVVEHHGIFQMLYYADHYGWDKNAREQFRDHPCFEVCSKFCEHWDQTSFNPDYNSYSLDHFKPMLQEVFSRKAYDPEVIQEGVVIGMPAISEQSHT